MSRAQYELSDAFRKAALVCIGTGILVALAGEGFAVLIAMGVALVFAKSVFNSLAALG